MRVSETFRSLQGEGPSAGAPATFVRLQGCNVGCRWCDTRYTWDPAHGREVPLPALLDELESLGPRDLLVMVLVGLLGWVTLYVLDRAAAAGPLCRSAPITFLQLPLTAGLSWLSTGFRPDLREAMGGGVILLLLAWAWLRWRPMSGEVLSERAT